ncbi:MAG: sigma-54 dependent transcriptional regulator [Candidatus Hydrogenedentota bacterium]
MPRVLLIDDDPQDLEILTEQLRALGSVPVTARRLDDALKILDEDNTIDLLLADIHLPDGIGSDLLEKTSLPVFLITAHAEIEEAVEAMRRGAFHYFTKPVRAEELGVILDRATRWTESMRELDRLRTLHAGGDEEQFVAKSAAMRSVVETARATAMTDASILILGESGTGKEILSRAIHRNSSRSQAPFVAVNCGAIPATLLESEFFGHERGAFTGAHERRIGKIERAQGGTLFLDEIGTLPVDLQTRLLRVIQDREVERLGGKSPIKVDFRLICATNTDLTKAIREGAFREDLFYRINVIPIRIPPLRERKEEIPALVAHFLKRKDAALVSIHPDVLDRLMNYDWPGNIRELENIVERLLVLSRREKILPKHLPEEFRSGPSRMREPAEAGDEEVFPTLDVIKREHVLRALRRTGGRREEAAHLLGLHRNTLRGIIARFDLEKELEHPLMRSGSLRHDSGRSLASKAVAS